MSKKSILLFVVMMSCIGAFGQTTIVTGTIQDSTGQALSYGTWFVSFHPNGFPPTSYNINGASFTQQFSGTLNINGLMSALTLTDNSLITPAGSQWDFQVCASTNTPCTTVTLTISGASQDVSTAISSQVPPLTVKLDPNPNSRPFARAYDDSEILGPIVGTVYHNVLDDCLHQYTQAGWVKICGGTSNAGSFNCPNAVFGAMLAATSTTAYGCDPQALTDFFGHFSAQSVATLSPYDGELQLTAKNADQPSALSTGTTSWIAPPVISTPFRNRMWPALCNDGQVAMQQSHGVDSSGTPYAQWDCGNAANISLTATSPIVITPSPFSTGSGVISCASCLTGLTQVQVNGTDTASQTPINFINGTNTTVSNPSVGQVRIDATPVRYFAFNIENSAGLAAGTTSASYALLTSLPACTIQAYSLGIDQGTITVKFWKVATGTAIPAVGNSINTSGVGISSGTMIRSTTLTDFTTTTVAAHDAMIMDITAVAGGATIVNGEIECQ